MSNINELVSKDKIKDIFINDMNNASSIEELLILKWHFEKIFVYKYSNIKNKVFVENIERISYNRALVNSKIIIEDLLNNYSLEQLRDKYDVTRESIKRIVSSSLNFNDYDEVVLEKIDSVKEEQDREFITAKAAVMMFIENKCYSSPLVRAKFNCDNYEYYKYLHILETNNHPIYKEFSLLYKHYLKEISSNINSRIRQHEKEERERINQYITDLDSKEILEILSNHNDIKFIDFSLCYGFETDILFELLKDNKELKYELANNKENIVDIYNQYVDRYKVLIKDVIRKIIILSKDKFTKPLDLYDYYTKTSLDIKILARLSKGFGDIKNNTLILQYLDKFPFVLEEISRKDITALKQKGIMSCCKDSISFSYSEFNRALSDIEERRIPLVKGVLYGSIENQIELRNSKVKKKVYHE